MVTRRPTRRAAAALVALATLASGCRDRARPPAAAATVKRVVSLAASSTEIVFALGAGDLLVGVDQYSDFPAAAQQVPRVGNELQPSIERILALKPDLVLTATSANSRDLVDQLTRLGVRVVVSESETLDDVWREIGNIGAALGRADAATRLVASLRTRVAAVVTRVQGLPRPRALVVVWTQPITVAGGHSFVDESIRLAGGDNVAGDAPIPYPQYSLERVLKRAPEVVIVGTHANAPSLGPLADQTSLPAVRDHRVHQVDGDLLFRPGPRLADGIEQLARLFHP